MMITQSDTVATTLTASAAGMANAIAVAASRSEAVASTPSTFYDSSVLENASAETWNEYEIQTQLGSNYTVENLSPCQSLIDGIVYPIGDGGFGRVRVTDGVVSKILKTDTTKRSGQTFREFVEYSEGSISRYLYDQVAPLFDATPDVDYFSAYNHATSTYTRNAACWASSIDLSCVAVASNDGTTWARQRSGVLIGEEGEDPEHVLIAAHFPYGVGTQVRFANAAGAVETRTVIGTSAAAVAGDLRVCALNAPVTIAGPCAVAGEWLRQGLEHGTGQQTALWYSGGIVIHTDQNAKIHAATLGFTQARSYSATASVTVNGQTFPQFTFWGLCQHANAAAIPAEFAEMRATPIEGDSGQPVFIIIEGEPVLLWCWHGRDEGPPVYQYDGAVLNALIVVANDNAVANGHPRPTDYTVTVAPDPTL